MHTYCLLSNNEVKENTQKSKHVIYTKIIMPYVDQRVLGLTWRPRRMSFFVDQKPVEISKNDSNTN